MNKVLIGIFITVSLLAGAAFLFVQTPKPDIIVDINIREADPESAPSESIDLMTAMPKVYKGRELEIGDDYSGTEYCAYNCSQAFDIYYREPEGSEVSTFVFATLREYISKNDVMEYQDSMRELIVSVFPNTKPKTKKVHGVEVELLTDKVDVSWLTFGLQQKYAFGLKCQSRVCTIEDLEELASIIISGL